METVTVVLPSGAELKITPAPFVEAKALYQSFLAEMKSLKLDPKAEVDVNFWKDIACTALASKQIEQAIEVCMKRATYKGLKIDGNTFEPIEARDDYFTVLFEVAKVNIQPFTKSLYAQYGHLVGMLQGAQA